MFSLETFKTKIFRYLIPLLLPVLAMGIHLLFKSEIGGRVFIFLYPCVFIGALIGGYGPGLLATLLSVFFSWYFIIPAEDSYILHTKSDIIGLLTFSFTGILVSIFSGLFHKFRKNFEIARDDAMAIIESNPISFLVVNSDLRVRLANKSFYESFHVHPTETEGNPISELGNGQWNIPILIDMLKKTLSDGTEFHGFEVEYDFPVIGLRHMVLNATRVRLPGSGIDTAILAIEDFTERRKIEHALKTSEEKYRNLVASAYDGIMVIHRNGTIEYANHQMERMFGYNIGELLNRRYDLLITERDRKTHLGHHEQYISDPERREMGKGLNLEGRRKDGSVFPIDISLSPFKSNSDTFVNCMVRDITAQKKMEEDRRHLLVQEKALREEAVRANRIKDEFLSTLSHELRTPLTTILGWAQELQSKNSLDESVKNGLSVIERSAQVQGQLINDLLDVSRIQSGKLLLDVQVIDLVEVLRLAIASAHILADKKSIKIECELPTSTHKVSADPYRLQQIFSNLLTNAIKFTPPEGRISVKLDILDQSKKRKSIQVQIKDTGIGIKPEFLKRIFERFSQADSSMARVHGGLGLGLAIVKSLVEMQNGTVAVESEGEGMGATFSICLPLILNKDKSSSEREAIDEEKKTLHRLDNLKILVVDDAVENRQLFSYMLKSLGAEVKMADSAKEGLRVLHDFKPDVLLSDISMPEEDGFSFIRKIRALGPELGGDIPAIALTAYAAAEDIRSVIDAGFSAHIAKPVEKTTLSHAISKVVQKHKMNSKR